MFINNTPTAFDVNFRLFRFPVRIHPLFWLIMAILGERNLQNQEIGPFALVLWVLCGLVSILVHELGHAVLIRWFGSPSEIVLYGFGGMATMPYPPSAPWKRLLIAFGGPLAGFILAALTIGFAVLLGPVVQNPYLSLIFVFLIWMNVIWGIMNLLPIWPLDGGRITRELLAILGFRHPDTISLKISMVTAGILAAYGLASALRIPVPVLDNLLPFRPSFFMTFWLALLAFESYQALQILNRQTRGWADDRTPWER